LDVLWTAEAEIDRREIISFIDDDNPEAAARMDRLFTNAAAKLGSFPMIGRPGAIQGTREFVAHENYRLVYQIVGEEIHVLALIHTSRQWPPAEPAP
jgi:toxin ParE1/3/4